MRGGFPGATQIARDAPRMIEMLKTWIRDTVGSREFSVVIDGGGARMSGGVKVIALMISAPWLPNGEVLVDIEVREEHETAESQAAFISRVYTAFGWHKKQGR